MRLILPLTEVLLSMGEGAFISIAAISISEVFAEHSFVIGICESLLLENSIGYLFLMMLIGLNLFVSCAEFARIITLVYSFIVLLIITRIIITIVIIVMIISLIILTIILTPSSSILIQLLLIVCEVASLSFETTLVLLDIRAHSCLILSILIVIITVFTIFIIIIIFINTNFLIP